MSLRDDLNKYTPRKEQKNALEYIKRVKREKPDNKFFLLLSAVVSKNKRAIRSQK